VVAQQKSKSFTFLQDNNGNTIDPYNDYDVSNQNLNMSFTIEKIPATLNPKEFALVDTASTSQPERILGIKTNEINASGAAHSTYDLKFDLSSTAQDMGQRATKLLYVKQGRKELAKFNLTPKDQTTTSNCTPQTEFQLGAQKFISVKMQELNLHRKDGFLVDRYNVIHLFLDQYGKFYGRGLPTTATPDYRFQLHLITSMCDATKLNFTFTYNGMFDDSFNINNTFENQAQGVAPTSTTITYIIIDYPEIGPFTGTLSLKVDRESTANRNKITILDKNIVIAKKYHATISAGLFATSLKNPQDIQKYPIPNSSDSTLIASDDINSRGVITVMATFYPQGRSFLLPPSGPFLGRDRLGIVVGTQIGSRYKENFFAGLSLDLARGLSVAGGVHYGRRNFVPGHRSFNYGEDKFEGPLVVKRQWVPGVFFGAIIDGRILGHLFPGLSNN
jgi:hypothetical protein